MSAHGSGTSGGSVSEVLRRAWLRCTTYVVALGLCYAAILGITLGVLQPRLAHDITQRADLRQLYAGLIDQETGLRGYLPTGDERFLAPYRSGVRQVRSARVSLERVAAGDPAIARVLATADRWERNWARVGLASKNHAPASPAVARASLEQGRRLLDTYRGADVAADRAAGSAVRADQRAETLLLGGGILVTLASVTAALVLSRRGRRRMVSAFEEPVRDLASSLRALGTDLPEQNAGRAALAVPAEFAELDRQVSGAARRLAAGQQGIGELLDVQQVMATASLDETRVIELIVERARSLTGADASVLELVDGAEMVYVGVAGAAEPYLGLRLPIDGSASGLSISAGLTLRIADTWIDGRVNQEACRRVGARSMLIVPLRAEGDLAGVLKIYADRPDDFDEDDEKTMDLLSGLAAVALQNARTHGEIVASRAEALLNASRFQMLFDHSPVGQAEMSADGSILLANDTFGAMLGRSPGQLIGMHVGDLTHPDDGDSLGTDVADLMSHRTSAYTSRRVYRHQDGHPVVALVSATLLTAPDGSQRIAGTAQDITESERAAASLGESERRFRTMFDASPIGIVQFDSAGRLAQSNDAFATMLGHHRMDLIGSRPELLVHPDDAAAVRAAMTDAWIGSSPAARLELRLLRDSGRIVWASVSMTAVEHDGESWLLMHAEDITASKASADRLAHLALHDPLTGLPNRVAALDRLEVALAGASRDRTPVHVLFIDLDGFKAVNDEHGHAAGDRVLIEVGARITTALRPGDTAARLAGDEFVVICPGVPDEATAWIISARLAAEITAPMLLGEVEVSIGASIGTCLSRPGQTPESVLAVADAAMYERKRASRDATGQAVAATSSSSSASTPRTSDSGSGTRLQSTATPTRTRPA